MKVVPIAGRPGDGSAASAASHSPASNASSARSIISQRRGAPFSARVRVALLDDRPRLRQPAEEASASARFTCVYEDVDEPALAHRSSASRSAVSPSS